MDGTLNVSMCKNVAQTFQVKEYDIIRRALDCTEALSSCKRQSPVSLELKVLGLSKTVFKHIWTPKPGE